MTNPNIHTDMLNRLTKGSVLVVHSQRILRTSVRSVLRAIGATNVHALGSYESALEAMSVRNFSYVFFENNKDRKKLPAEFAKKAKKINSASILIAMFEPAYLEDLFTCLQAGVRGFVVIPCTPDALESTLLKATEGLNIPQSLLEGNSWNVIFAKFVLKQLDHLCKAVHRSREDAELLKELQVQTEALRDAVKMGKAYCDGGDEGFLQEIFSQCMNRASDNRSRLRKVRERLAKEREKGVGA